MRKKSIFVILLMLAALVHAKKLVTLPELTKPTFMSVDKDQFYVVEGASVSIYSLEDYKLKVKFGQAGEGPQEFKPAPGGMGLMVLNFGDDLVVNSQGKVSFFTRDGKFKSELYGRNRQTFGMYQPIGKGYAGVDLAMGKNRSLFLTTNIFDEKLGKVKELGRKPFFAAGKMKMPFAPPIVFVYDNKIIFPVGKEFKIHITDAEGNLLHAIEREYKQLKMTETYKERVHTFFKTSPATKAFYEVIKKNLEFYDYFPVIQNLMVADGKIYIFTYLEKDEKFETFIYRVDGKFIKKTFLPRKYISALLPSPSYIRDNKYYQLLENEETEEWELHVLDLK